MKSRLIKGAFFVTLATLLVKLLSIAYKIPYQNVTGDKGFYIYQQLYPIFALFIVMSQFAFPLAISENLVIQKKKREVLNASFFTLMIYAVVLSILFGISIPYLGRVMGDGNLSHVFYPLIPLILLVPVISLLRGFYYSNVKTLNRVGISIVIEQFFRVLLIIFCLYLYVKSNTISKYEVAQYSYYGFSLGLIISSAYLLFKFNFKLLNVHDFQLKVGMNIIKRGLLLLFSSSILLFYQLVDSFTIVNELSITMSKELAMETKGVYDRALPIIQSAIFFVPPILSSMIPHVKKRDYNKIIMLILFFAMPATLGLIIVLKDLNIILFQNAKHTNVLQISAVIVLLYGLVLTYTTILKDNKKNSIIITIGLISKIIFNFLLIQPYGIMGAAMSSVMSLFLILMIFVVIYRKQIQIHFILTVKILLSTGFMYLIVYLVSLYQDQFVLKILVGLISYFTGAYLLNIKKENLMINESNDA